MIRCDVLVAGPGPAGALSALVLKRAGFRVVIAGQPNVMSLRLGESLPGVAMRLLGSLGFDNSGFGSVHRKIGGNLACWSSKELDATDFLCAPDGPGWRLCRRSFDESLLSAAISAGVQHLPFNVETIVRNRDNWEARMKSGDTPGDTIISRWLVEATGRSSSLARKLRVSRTRDDDLVALIGFGSPRACAALDRTLIEAVPEGWWYGAVLPEGAGVLVLHVLPREAGTVRRNWLQALERTAFIREFFPPSAFGGRVSVRDAGGSRLQSLHGANWVACGDAAMAFDPLSSQGIYTAMYSGVAAARAILASEGGDSSAMPSYASRLDCIRRIYRVRLASSYRSVTRWPNSQFWAMRDLDPVAV